MGKNKHITVLTHKILTHNFHNKSVYFSYHRPHLGLSLSLNCAGHGNSGSGRELTTSIGTVNDSLCTRRQYLCYRYSITKRLDPGSTWFE